MLVALTDLHISLSLRMFDPLGLLCILTANANSHATSCIKRTLSTKMNNDRADGIGTALLGFNDLGCSVTATFLFRNRFYLQLSPHCPKINKKSMWEVKKNFSPRDMESCHLALQGE